MKTHFHKTTIPLDELKKIRHKSYIVTGNLINKQIYQLDSNGVIIDKFDSINEIDWKVRRYITKQKIINGGLFVYVKDYKTTINYNILI